MDGGFDDEMKEAPKRHGKGKKLKKSIYPSKLKHGVHETYDEYSEEEEYEGWVDEDDASVEESRMMAEHEICGTCAKKIDFCTCEDNEENSDEDGEIEATEASRVIANKRKAKRGLMAAPKQLKEEVLMLREKNEEYKKALDFFRTKLDEVAVFNSNLAYSTRLFTEHSTTKQEKINILRRFDNVENIKESKNLYKTIKEELGGSNTKGSIKESVQNRVVRTPQTGSSSNLIESKTYENPQFLRMKDLMTKIK